MKKSITHAAIVMAVMTAIAFANQKITCRITGETMDQCCCETKNGKFYCKLTKKTYDDCCCDMK
jgi:hypothetical protein